MRRNTEGTERDECGAVRREISAECLKFLRLWFAGTKCLEFIMQNMIEGH